MIKILAVEESPSIRNILEITFPAPEFELHLLNIDRELPDRLSRFHPDVIFLNISSPNGDGIEIARDLNSHESSRNIPLLLFIGAFDPVDEDGLKDLDFVGLIREPFDSNELKNLVLSLSEKESKPRSLPEEPGSEAPASSDWKEEFIEKVRFVVKTQFEENQDAIAEKVLEKVLRELKYKE